MDAKTHKVSNSRHFFLDLSLSSVVAFEVVVVVVVLPSVGRRIKLPANAL